MRPSYAALLAACVLVAGCATGCSADDDRGEPPLSDAPLTLLGADQLDAALLTQRTVGPTYRRVDAVTAPALGCLDALDPALLADDASGDRSSAEVEYVAAGADQTTTVTSVVVSFTSERAVSAAFDAFSVAASGCREVGTDDGTVSQDVEVTSRLVPVADPVRREVLVEARGNTSDGVRSPAVGRVVKVGWIDHHLLAVETTGAGTYAPDVTPYFNTARSRLLAVVAGEDPGRGRPVRG